MKKFFIKIFRFLKRDILRKIIALVFAVLLYQAIERGRELQLMQFDRVPVEVIMPEGMVCAGGGGDVDISFKYDRRDKDQFSRVHGQIRFEPAKYTPGVPYRVMLSEKNFNLPHGVSDFKVEPSLLTLNIESIVRKKVPVTARYDANKLSKDYTAGEIRFDPDSVELTGPSTLLKGIDSVYCAEAIPLDRTLTVGFDRVMKLRIPNGVKCDVPEVLVTVEIVANNTVRHFRNLPLSLLFGGAEKRFYRPKEALPTVEITVEGMAEKLKSLPPEALRPYLDLSAVGEGGRQTLPIKCIVPAGESGFVIKAVHPEKITLDLIK